MPPTNSGSAFIGDMIGKWALLLKPNITVIQKQQLTELVSPLLATSPLGTFGFLESLSYIIPKAFKQNQYLWIVSGQLSKSIFYSWAKDELSLAHGAGKQDIINSILEKRDSKECALLWIELNPGKKKPVSIIKELLSAKWSSKTESEENEIAQKLEDFQNQIGEKRWQSFLRWCLTDNNDNIAASSALQLLEHREESFYLIGNALSKVLDRGGISNKAETALRQIISRVKGSDINWTYCLFRDSRRMYGASAGSWRILLDNLITGLDNGPDILVGYIDAIGPFNLPRYPDIRLLLQTLLTGKNGKEYRRELRNALNHCDPSIRLAASMILTVSCPSDEGLALITTVSFIGHRISSDSWEWEKFLLTLNFGSSVLESLKSSLPLFNPKARNLGLALLLRHGYSLTENEQCELFSSDDFQIREFLGSTELSGFGIRSDIVRNILLKELENRPLKKCKYIAESLLKYHEKISFC